MNLYALALAYRAAGLCPVPILPGYKHPTWHNQGVVYSLTWSQYQTVLPTEAELAVWFDHASPLGIGIITGQASGGVESLDLDDAAYVALFLEQANFCGLAPLLARLVQERTPRQGMHISYRCVTIEGNRKLAVVLDATGYIGTPHCVIETRGQGGFLVVAPTPPGIHPDAPTFGYELLTGSWECLPEITPDERQLLWEVAQSFHTVITPSQTVGRSSSPLGRQHAGIGRPGDDLNIRADMAWWHDLLTQQGWLLLGTNQRGIQQWQRPGKAGQHGASATLGACGPYLYVFSTNASPLEANKAYAPFGAYAFLAHGGNFQAAALALRQQGYGGQVPSLPEIRISADLSSMIDAAQDALMSTSSDPLIYTHADRLCILRRHHEVSQGIYRDVGMPRIATLEEAHLTELSSMTARWLKHDKRGNKWEHALPFSKALQGLLARGTWDFPALTGIITAPTLRLDGTYLDAPGYDVLTGLYFETNGVDFLPPILRPTLDDARSAIGRIQEAVQDFPFVPLRQGFSSTLACLLTLLCRHMVQGNVPLFAFTATESRTGKSLLASALALIALGRLPAHYPQVDEDEERKRLLAIAIEGDACVLIDNVSEPLGSPSLDLILTAQKLGGRLLGMNATVTVPWNAVLMATGNNLSYKGDMAGRVVQIALDAKMERPEERPLFAQRDLLQWTNTHRPELVHAALTIILAYRDAGAPEQQVRAFGGFEMWSDRIRSALVWAGEDDPCPGRALLQQRADPMHERYVTLVQCWDVCINGVEPDPPLAARVYVSELDTVARPVHMTFREAVRLCYKYRGSMAHNEWDALLYAFMAFDERARGELFSLQAVDTTLRAFHDRIVGQRVLRRESKAGRDGVRRYLESV